ncbi:MAG: glycosyltransferase [bacterium]
MVETSVIIPTYNRLAFLQEAVQSVLEQSYRDFELILVDDGSTDGTKDLMRQFGEAVKYVGKKHGGPASARNRGIREARGAFVTFLDSDDLWLRDKLQVQIEYMKSRPEAMVCYTDEIWIRKGVRVNPRKKHAKYSGWIFERCVPLCIVSPSSVLMRKEFFREVGCFDEALAVCEDYDLWLRASLRFPFHFIPQKLIIKRGGHGDQLSSHWGCDCFRVQALLKLLQREALSPKQRQLVVDKLVEKCQILEQGFRKRAKLAEAEFYQHIRLSFCNR